MTASDPSGSIGGGSRDSNTSIRKKRNGSVDSSKRSATQPATLGRKQDEVNATSAQSAQMPKPKKSRGFLSFLNCCGVPDNANGVDSEEAAVPVKPVTADPLSTRATEASKTAASSPEVKTARKPTECDKAAMSAKDEPNQINEKSAGEDMVTTEMGGSERGAVATVNQVNDASTTPNNQPLPAIPTDSGKSGGDWDTHLTTNPTVFVEAPTPNPIDDDADNNDNNPLSQVAAGHNLSEQNSSSGMPAQEAKDTDMTEVQPTNSALPPPPPLPMAEATSSSSTSPTEAALAEAIEEKQQWLLPPITERFKGKKCLVLDLDETLVHSSFKVYIAKWKVSARRLTNVLRRSCIKPILQFQSRLRERITTSM